MRERVRKIKIQKGTKGKVVRKIEKIKIRRSRNINIKKIKIEIDMLIRLKIKRWT